MGLVSNNNVVGDCFIKDLLVLIMYETGNGSAPYDRCSKIQTAGPDHLGTSTAWTQPRSQGETRDPGNKVELDIA